MRKQKIAFVLALVLLVAFAGWQNKKVGQTPHNTKVSSPQETKSTAAEADLTDQHRIIREYPDLDIVIDAVCPAVMEARNLPCLTAHFPGTYFDNMLQKFLKQFPEAKEVDENNWVAFGPESEVLAYLCITETGYISFMNKELDVNSIIESDHDYFSYDPLDEASIHNICVLPDDQLVPSDLAIKKAIHAVSTYTDFDLIPYNIVKETDSTTEKSWYRIKLQLSYQGTPICRSGQGRNVSADVGMADVGLGAMSRCFSFSQVKEKGSCHVMSIEDILTIFEQQGYLSILTAYDYKGDSRYEIYRIQPEYFVEFGDNPGEASFRPVWSFYYKVYHPKDSSSWSYGEINFYADTGEICYIW